MIDFHSSIPINQSVQSRSNMEKIKSQPFLFSARPKIQELPFLNNLKLARKLLVALKNQKLRKSLYVVTEGCEVLQKQENEMLRHEKAKLSVMDLISEEGKFEQLSNTIKSNLNKNSISPVLTNQKQEGKEKDKGELNEFELEQSQGPLKGNQNDNKKLNDQLNSHPRQKENEKQTVLSRKNKLASELNKLGHQLEQTYFQVEEMQNIFYSLCSFYSQNRKTVQKNLKLKEEKDLIRQNIQEFKIKIRDNQRQEILMKDKLEDFQAWYKQNTKTYIKDVIQFNRQIDQIHSDIQQCSRQLLSNSKVDQQYFLLNSKQQLENNYEEEGQKSNDQAFKINLQFKILKTELERIKAERKSNVQNKNIQKKQKNESNQSNTFSKLYVSELYSL